MAQIQIPQTIEEATAALNGLGRLLTAKEWERAAIVYAFTRDDKGRGDKVASIGDFRLPIERFAALGIIGLKSHQSVSDYRKAWQSAMQDGAAEAKPGEAIELPNLPWPPGTERGTKQHTPTRSEAIEGFRREVLENPVAAIHELVRGEPEASSALATGVSADPTLVALVVRERDRALVRDVIPIPSREIDYSARLRLGVDALLTVLTAMRDDKWEPDPMERVLIDFLAQAFTEISTGKATSIIEEIEAFLVAQR